MYKGRSAKQWYDKFIATEKQLERYKKVANERDKIIKTNPFKQTLDKVRNLIGKG